MSRSLDLTNTLKTPEGSIPRPPSGYSTKIGDEPVLGTDREREADDCPRANKTAPSTPGRRSAIKVLFAVVVFLIGAFILAVTTSRTDYIEYWASARLLVKHSDPYSPAGIMALEKSQGFRSDRPIIMLNPPWALFLIAPLGFVGLRTGLFLWTIVTAMCVVASVWLLRAPPGNRAFAYVFAPAVAAVFMGQSSTFLLLGFTLFLALHRSHPFLSGVALLLMAIKPHLFFVFWFVLLVDCIATKRYTIILGGIAALALSSLLSMFFDPRVWQDYVTMFRGYKIQQGFLPTASMLFRMLIDVHAFWLLFVPSAIATAWGIRYYIKNKNQWDWRRQGMLLMIVTVFASPYGYFTDEAVLLPSILYALSFRKQSKHAAWTLLAVNTIALALVLGRHALLASRAYMWTPITWLLWYLYATHGHRAGKSPATAAELDQTTNTESAP